MLNLLPQVPQLFLDEACIAEARRVVRRWLPASVYPDPVLVPDRPWEGPAVVAYGTALPDPTGGFRMYYQNFLPTVPGGWPGAAPLSMCALLAQSDDGRVWRKPDLDLFPTKDGRPTNIVQRFPGHIDSLSVLHEPDSEDPWKMLGFAFDSLEPAWNETWGLHAFTSPDGLSWTPLRADGLPSLQAGDRTNLLSERVDGEYYAYTRHPRMFEQTGARSVYLTRSPNFRDWTEPELVLTPDLSDEPDVEFYGMSVFRRHGWFFGLLEYWHSATDCIEVHLAVSRDGRKWHRPLPHVPFLAAEYPWNAKWSTCASNGPLVVNEQMLFHFGGRLSAHHYDSANLHGVIGYASLPLDRFCALESGNYGGQVTTHACLWPGGDLALNADTRESFESHPAACNGEIGVEVLAEDGEPLPEWSGEQRATFRGNTHCRGRIDPGIVRWPGARSLDALRGQPVRLRFQLRHARLFSFASTAREP